MKSEDQSTKLIAANCWIDYKMSSTGTKTKFIKLQNQI